jgi:hypothetical protein
MENKVINLQINDNINATETAVKSLKAQLREAQNEVNTLSDKFGATSREAVEAAKQAAVLKDKIGDAKALTEAFNPDAKFKAVSASLTGVAGGFSVVTGAMGAFGTSSKAVEEQLLKVQSAMALASGLQAVGESIDSFKQLGAVVKSYSVVQKAITAGQWLWNAAQAANPIGLLVAGIAALIAAGAALVSYFKSSAAESAANTRAVNENKRALESQALTLQKNSSALETKQNQELAMAKASGASASAIRALELKLIDEKIAYEKSARAIAFNTYEKNKNKLASLQAAGADEDLIKKQIEITNDSVKQVNKQNDNLQKAYNERTSIQNKHQVEIRQSQTNHNKEISDKNREAANKAKEVAAEAAKKEADDKKKYDEETKAGLEVLRQANLEKDLEDSAKKRSLLDEQIALLDEGTTAERVADEKRVVNADENSKAMKAIADAEAKAKKDALNFYGDALGSLAGMLGESTAAGKAAAVASATISTYSSANKAYESQLAIPTPDAPIRATIAAGIAIAGGLLNVKKILSVQAPGGGGGGGGSVPSPTTMTAPNFNVVGASSTNQLAQTIGNQQNTPVQAYVVSNDVTTAQALDRSIIRGASL